MVRAKLPTMSQSDQKIARQILRNPEQIVDCAISELANLTQVSGASVTRFCHNLGLTGFHNLKIQIAQASSNEKSQSLKDIANDDL